MVHRRQLISGATLAELHGGTASAAPGKRGSFAMVTGISAKPGARPLIAGFDSGAERRLLAGTDVDR